MRLTSSSIDRGGTELTVASGVAGEVSLGREARDECASGGTVRASGGTVR